MGLFSKFFGKLNSSDIDLSRPDFENAGVEEISLGSVSLKLRDPKQTANIPLVSTIKNLDIFDESKLIEESEGNFVKSLYTRGWNFYGDENKARGGVVADLVVMFDPETYKPDANYFSCSNLKDVALEHCHVVWGSQNNSSTIGDIGTGKILYPINQSEVEIKNINSIDYAVVKKTSKNFPPVVCYFVALSEQHILIFSFSIDAYEGKDFYPVDIDSPATNLKEVAYWTIEQFISHLEIKR